MRKRKSARQALQTVDKNTRSKGKMNVKKKARTVDKASDAGGAKLNDAAMASVPGDDTAVHGACWWSDWREPVDADKCRDFSEKSFGKGNKRVLSFRRLHHHTRL